MTTLKKILIAGAAGFALLAGVGIAAAQGMRHGMWGGPGGMGPMGRVCSDERNERVDDMLKAAKGVLEITPAQQPAWDSLAAAVDRAETKLDAGCTQVEPLRERAQDEPTVRLQIMEVMMGSGLEALKEVRPAVDELYAQLTPDQRKTVERFMDRGRRWGRGDHDGDRDGNDGER